MWWKVLLFLWIAAFSALGIMTPVAGNLGAVTAIGKMSPGRMIPLKFSVTGAGTETGTMRIADEDGTTTEVETTEGALQPGSTYVADAGFQPETRRIRIGAILARDPWLTFPFIPGLEERAKIIFFHVPMSWLTVIAFLVAMWYGIRYLRKKDLEDDLRSSVSAGLGLLFCILATTTGSVWAKFNWGSFWNWDPRESSIFVLLLVYGAYFALRSAIEGEEKRATLSAVYSIMAFVTVPFFIFIMPRIMPGLHPGSSDDVNSGPVVSSGGMDALMRVVLYSMLAGCLVLYAWLMRLHLRIARLTHRWSIVSTRIQD